MKNFKLLATSAAILVFATAAALAQSSPGFVNGQVPSASQWNSYFAAKQDYFGTPAAIATSGSATDLITGIVPVGRLSLATISTPGIVQPDNSTIGISGGVISVIGGGASHPCTSTANSLQYNNAGAFGCVSGVTSAGTAMAFATNALTLSGSTSGSTTINASAIAAGVLTLPAATDTLVGRATTDTLTSKTISGSSNTLSNIANASLTNSSMTIAGHVVALGGTQALAAADLSNGVSGSGAICLASGSACVGSSGLTVGTTTITSGTSGRVLYDNAGILGELSVTGTGSVVLSASPTFTGTPALAAATATTPSTADNSTNVATTAYVQAQGYALNGIGSVRTTSPTITAAQFNTQCPLFTINANSLNFALPAASTLQANGGCMTISNPLANSATVTPNGTDALNGVNAALTLPPGTLTTVTSDGSSSDYMVVPVSLSVSQDWDGAQSNKFKALTPSVSTITPDCSRNNYSVTFVHANTPFTFANPSCTLKPGTVGLIDFKQSATGGETVTTWGSNYVYAGGTSTIAFSTGASVVDSYGYIVREDGTILLTPGGNNATH